MLIVGIFFFFHCFIGCSSSDIKYKFVIQHTHTHKKRKKRRSKKKTKGGRSATGLTSHARHRSYRDAPPLFYPKSILTFLRIIFEVELFELRGPEPGYNHFLLFCFVLFCFVFRRSFFTLKMGVSSFILAKGRVLVSFAAVRNVA